MNNYMKEVRYNDRLWFGKHNGVRISDIIIHNPDVINKLIKDGVIKLDKKSNNKFNERYNSRYSQVISRSRYARQDNLYDELWRPDGIRDDGVPTGNVGNEAHLGMRSVDFGNRDQPVAVNIQVPIENPDLLDRDSIRTFSYRGILNRDMGARVFNEIIHRLEPHFPTTLINMITERMCNRAYDLNLYSDNIINITVRFDKRRPIEDAFMIDINGTQFSLRD